MANIIKYKGQLYKRVDSTFDSTVELKNFRDASSTRRLAMDPIGWSNSLDDIPEHGDKEEERLILAIIAKAKEGAKELKLALHYLNNAIRYYEEYDKLVAQYKHKYE